MDDNTFEKVINFPRTTAFYTLFDFTVPLYLQRLETALRTRTIAGASPEARIEIVASNAWFGHAHVLVRIPDEIMRTHMRINLVEATIVTVRLSAGGVFLSQVADSPYTYHEQPGSIEQFEALDTWTKSFLPKNPTPRQRAFAEEQYWKEVITQAVSSGNQRQYLAERGIVERTYWRKKKELGG